MGIHKNLQESNRPNTFQIGLWTRSCCPLHFRQHTLEIAKVLKLDIGESKHERLFQLQQLEEEKIIAIQHQEAQKQQ